MAFAHVGNIGSGNSATANQAAAICTYTTAASGIGDLAVLVLAVDNNQTTDGDENAVTSAGDNQGNTYLKGAEFTNGQGSAQAGATCSIWYCVLAHSVASGDFITANLSNATSRDRTAFTIHRFSFGAGNTLAIEGTPGTLANDGADPGSLNVTTSNIECLRVRGIAAESSSATALTATDGTWTVMTGDQTGSGGSAANMAVRGEFKISTGTGAASDPTLFAADCASVYVAFREVVTATPNFNPRKYQVNQAVNRASTY